MHEFSDESIDMCKFITFVHELLDISMDMELTHLRLVSLLWDIGKQHSPRCDAAERGVPSGAILFAWRNFIERDRN